MIYDAANLEVGDDRQVGTSKFNEKDDDNAYVGFMYGTPASGTYEETHKNINDSTIKKYLDNWYKNNLLSYSDKINDTEFCNDRSITDGSLGYGNNNTEYAPSSRIGYNPQQKNPSLICLNKNDRFTVSDTQIGNGSLTYPVGLLTADEASYAGSIYNTSNNSYYLFNSNYTWLMTPYSYVSDMYYPSLYIFYIGADGILNSITTSQNYGVRPVINIKPDVTISGMGTMNNPFTIS